MVEDGGNTGPLHNTRVSMYANVYTVLVSFELNVRLVFYSFNVFFKRCSSKSRKCLVWSLKFQTRSTLQCCKLSWCHWGAQEILFSCVLIILSNHFELCRLCDWTENLWILSESFNWIYFWTYSICEWKTYLNFIPDKSYEIGNSINSTSMQKNFLRISFQYLVSFSPAEYEYESH